MNKIMCQPSERVKKDDMLASLQKFESMLEYRQVVMKGAVHENDSCDIVQQILNHYETPRKEIDKSLRAFHSDSNFFAKPKQSTDNSVYEEGDEAVPSNSSSPERNPPVTLNDLQEDPEKHSKYSQNFRHFEREKAKESIQINPNSSKLHQRLCKSSDNFGEKGGSSNHRINEAQSNYAENDEVIYISSAGEMQSATILKVHLDPNHDPFYDIRLHISGVDQQTDCAHLTDLPATRRPRTTRRQNSATIRKISTERRSVSKDRKVQSASELSRRHVKQAALPTDMSNSTWDLGTSAKISTQRRSVSKDRKVQSASELSRRHVKQAALPTDMSNSTWDLGTSASSLQKGRAGAKKLHRSNSAHQFVSSVSSKSQFKRRDQERSTRVERVKSMDTQKSTQRKPLRRTKSIGKSRQVEPRQGAPELLRRAKKITQRSWSSEAMDTQKSTRRKPLRRIKSIDQSGFVVSVRHVEPRPGASELQLPNTLSSQNATFPKQGLRKMPSLSRAQSCTKQNGSTQMPTLSRTQSCPVPRNILIPHGENLGTTNNGLHSANRPTISTAQVVPGSYRAITPGSQHSNVGGNDTPSTLKKRSKSSLLWQKAKNVSNLLPRQHL